ncbi:hypothetical protein PPUJ20028_26990 [Pseudomonas putida]|uniref:Transposase n=1 Tax=Pseudomonas putida TaxID=303 RepID=A0AA37RAI9_PSEPU|nr:hypothetical protein PPUJ20028_26990 [Pseudomonas putida]GLO33896.1 hypothetical protein PPUN14671_07290 [Pseudomonas putida]
MSRERFPKEFKIEAIKQVTEKGNPVADVAQRLGMSAHNLYAWIKLYSNPQEQQTMTSKPSRMAVPGGSAELSIRRLSTFGARLGFAVSFGLSHGYVLPKCILLVRCQGCIMTLWN